MVKLKRIVLILGSYQAVELGSNGGKWMEVKEQELSMDYDYALVSHEMDNNYALKDYYKDHCADREVL